MTVTLDLPADMERRLQLRAAQQGKDVNGLLLDLAEREALTVPPQLTDEEFERISEELADAVGPDVPNWTNEDLSREVIYGDRA